MQSRNDQAMGVSANPPRFKIYFYGQENSIVSEGDVGYQGTDRKFSSNTIGSRCSKYVNEGDSTENIVIQYGLSNMDNKIPQYQSEKYSTTSAEKKTINKFKVALNRIHFPFNPLNELITRSHDEFLEYFGAGLSDIGFLLVWEDVLLDLRNRFRSCCATFLERK